MNTLQIPVFYYHSVAPRADRRWRRFYLTFPLAYFEDLIRYLTGQGFTFLTLDEYFAERQKADTEKRRLICLTFDDGYLDNYIFVYPVLKKFGAKATIFVSPDFVQDGTQPRPTLFDVWDGKWKIADLESLGFASWAELRVMQDSGVIDIQPHTMTHTKYFVSGKLCGFHHRGGDPLYPISNRFPFRKPYYITDPEFFSLIPYGTPFFEEKSAIIARKVSISEDFQNECCEALKSQDWSRYSFQGCFEKVESLYRDYISRDRLIDHVESDLEYEKRVRAELRDSRRIISENMGKSANHCCWPHGKYSENTHRWAIEEGYRSTTIVLKPGEVNLFQDRFDRTGCGIVLKNRILTKLKGIYKLQAYREVFPYRQIRDIYNRIAYGVK